MVDLQFADALTIENLKLVRSEAWVGANGTATTRATALDFQGTTDLVVRDVTVGGFGLFTRSSANLVANLECFTLTGTNSVINDGQGAFVFASNIADNDTFGTRLFAAGGTLDLGAWTVAGTPSAGYGYFTIEDGTRIVRDRNTRVGEMTGALRSANALR